VLVKNVGVQIEVVDQRDRQDREISVERDDSDPPVQGHRERFGHLVPVSSAGQHGVGHRIGDAADAMSPAGGVGINLAIQDAVATARLLAAPLLAHHVRILDLAAVQRRRTLPTAVTQGLQRVMHPGISRQPGQDIQPPAAVAAVAGRLPGLSVMSLGCS